MQLIRLLTILFYVFLLTILSWAINYKSLIGIDDANIYMVYMRNFANGHGFVYNIGGERVEGFTSLLWTLLGSLFFCISNYPEKLLLLVNIIIISYTLHTVSNYLDRNTEYESSLFSEKSLFFLAVIGITPGFIDWTVLSLMETGLWCFLLTSILLKILEHKTPQNKYKYYIILNFLQILLVLCRPESMLLVPFFILINAIKEFFLSKNIKDLSIWSSISILVFLASLLLLIYLRLNYFGYPLPNTYYAKVSSSRIDNIISGIKYLYVLFLQKPFLLVIFIYSAWVIFNSILNKKFFSRLSVFLLFLVMCVSLAIPLYSGGDHFGLHRFIMPFIPIIFLLGIVIFAESNLFNNKTNLIMVAMLIFFSNKFNFISTWIFKEKYLIKEEWYIAIDGRNLSHKLNDFFKDNKKLPSQGVLVAGGTAFGYNGETIDLLGLNNTKMAHANKVKDKNLPKNHASFNLDVFFELNPDLFWYSHSGFLRPDKEIKNKISVDTSNFISRVFKNCHTDERFIKNYGFFRIVRQNKNDEALEIFANKKFINSLNSSIFKITPIKYE